MSTTDFVQYTSIAPPAPDNNGEYTSVYYVTADNTILASTQFYGLFYRISQ